MILGYIIAVGLLIAVNLLFYAVPAFCLWQAIRKRKSVYLLLPLAFIVANLYVYFVLNAELQQDFDEYVSEFHEVQKTDLKAVNLYTNDRYARSQRQAEYKIICDELCQQLLLGVQLERVNVFYPKNKEVKARTFQLVRSSNCVNLPNLLPRHPELLLLDRCIQETDYAGQKAKYSIYKNDILPGSLLLPEGLKLLHGSSFITVHSTEGEKIVSQSAPVESEIINLPLTISLFRTGMEGMLRSDTRLSRHKISSKLSGARSCHPACLFAQTFSVNNKLMQGVWGLFEFPAKEEALYFIEKGVNSNNKKLQRYVTHLALRYRGHPFTPYFNTLADSDDVSKQRLAELYKQELQKKYARQERLNSPAQKKKRAEACKRIAESKKLKGDNSPTCAD